jgi:hypothetical protein
VGKRHEEGVDAALPADLGVEPPAAEEEVHLRFGARRRVV